MFQCVIENENAGTKPISDTAHLEQALNTADDTHKVKPIDYDSHFKDIIDKINKLKILMKKVRIDPNLIKYLPGTMKIGYLLK